MFPYSLLPMLSPNRKILSFPLSILTAIHTCSLNLSLFPPVSHLPSHTFPFTPSHPCILTHSRSLCHSAIVTDCPPCAGHCYKWQPAGLGTGKQKARVIEHSAEAPWGWGFWGGGGCQSPDHTGHGRPGIQWSGSVFRYLAAVKVRKGLSARGRAGRSLRQII